MYSDSYRDSFLQTLAPRTRSMRNKTAPILAALVVTSLAGSALRAQGSTTGSFVTTLGRDTLAIEQYTRDAKSLEGDYVVRPGGTIVNHYIVHFGADGTPLHVILTQKRADGSPIPGLKSVELTVNASDAVIVVQRDTAVTRKFAVQKPLPLLGTSFGLLELALARLRSEKADSGAFPGLPLNARELPLPVPVKFFGADSARFWDSKGAWYLRVDQTGKIFGFSGRATDTHIEGRRVATLDVAKLITAFGAADVAGKGIPN